MRFHIYIVIFIIMISFIPGRVSAQETHYPFVPQVYPKTARAHDSIMAVKTPVLSIPEMYHKSLLPPMVDNSKNEYWPGMQDQTRFYTCQQYAGVAYVFGYEINRSRNQPGWYWENSYPTHYTWNFMNGGERYNGVNFLQSFEVIRQQGHMTKPDYGLDTSATMLGWITGYDKYYRGMSNHIKQVYAIDVNGNDGITTLKNYLYDHLDGSPTGGIACFTTDASVLNSVPVIPPGIPEAGKHLVPELHMNPNHGMAVVGYNDSVRYDINGDGQYTNTIDINGDGIVDARDWEIGAFKIANTYGNWWADTGYAYVLYRSFALDYHAGGIWNNKVYVVEPDTAYNPLLTVKLKLNYNSRNKIRVLAGVSSDTVREMPDHVIDFPTFNFQGGDHVMQGTDSVPEAKTIEFGLDVTPLLNFVSAGTSARWFLMVEERDPDHLGNGVIQQASFVNYQDGPHEFPVSQENVVIKDNNVTLVSATGTMAKPTVRVLTNSLPPLVPAQPYHVQLEASGGKPPYDWSFHENYSKIPSVGAMPAITGTSIQSHDVYKSFTAVALPFSFPFYGQNYDSLYVNNFGFVTFTPQYLPEPYASEEMNMLEMFATVTPAFSQLYSYQVSKNDGIWFQANASRAIVRWKVSVSGHVNSSVNDFALILYPDGRFEFRYGTMNNPGFLQTFYTGVSKGDDLNFNLETQWDANLVSGKSFLFVPPVAPAGITLGKEGLLSVTRADSTQIYELPVRVADAGRITGSKVLVLSGGLELGQQLICGSDGMLESGHTAALKLVLTNTGLQAIPNLTLRIRSVDSLLQITDSVYTVGLLQPGIQLTIPSAFSFGLKKVLPNDFLVRLDLQAQSGQRNWKKAVQIPVAAPELVVGSPQVADGDNNILDPGEVADLIVNIKNTGAVPARDLGITLISSGQDISILSNPRITIDQIKNFSSEDLRFQIQASRDVTPGSEVAMQVSLMDSSGQIQTNNFTVRVGTRSVALVNLAASQNSAMAMMNALDSIRVGYDTINALPFDYTRYLSVFLILGTSGSGSHVVTVSEGASLASYLQRGGNLYMEGYHTWYYLNRTALHPYFKYTSAKIPAWYYPEVTGIQGTFTNSMSYLYPDPLNFAIFSFEPLAPAYSTLINTDSPAKNLEIVYDGNDYKTIGTMLGFGALIGDLPPSTQTTLMQRYLEFFGLNLTGPYPYFHAGMTSVCLNQPVTFTDDSFDNITSRSWEFEGGTPDASNEISPVVRYRTSGRYDVRLTVSDGTRTRTIFKQKYIQVGECSGTEEHRVASAFFRVFPNPSYEQVTVEIDRNISGSCKITLLDLTGCNLMEIQQNIPANNRIVLNTNQFSKGLYFLKLQAGGLISTMKVIKN